VIDEVLPRPRRDHQQRLSLVRIRSARERAYSPGSGRAEP
jgi:hypothetical protein